MKITNDIKYIGVNDYDIDLFESQYEVPNGIAYNSYVILDDKVTVMDTVDRNFKDEWLGKLESALEGRTPDYLVVQHMEPDHSGNIEVFLEKYPSCVVVSSAKSFQMMKGFFDKEYEDRRLIIKEGDVLDLGHHKLQFVGAPMVHWPEVMMTYDQLDKAIFTADAFGKFGTLDVEEPWDDEARRYYIGIVGKYGVQVQNLLKKIANLEINMILPLHGPIITDDLNHYIGLYDKWSSYTPEEDGVVIAYSSVYGNTKNACLYLENELKKLNVKVESFDLARSDINNVTGLAFKYSKLVLASVTYNADIFPDMKNFINHLTERNYKNRKVAFIENGSWAPMATKVMKCMLECSKDLTYLENNVSIKSGVHSDTKEKLTLLAEELSK